MTTPNSLGSFACISDENVRLCRTPAIDSLQTSEVRSTQLTQRAGKFKSKFSSQFPCSSIRGLQPGLAACISSEDVLVCLGQTSDSSCSTASNLLIIYWSDGRYFTSLVQNNFVQHHPTNAPWLLELAALSGSGGPIASIAGE